MQGTHLLGYQLSLQQLLHLSPTYPESSLTWSPWKLFTALPPCGQLISPLDPMAAAGSQDNRILFLWGIWDLPWGLPVSLPHDGVCNG